MIDLDIVRKKGVTQEHLQNMLQGDPLAYVSNPPTSSPIPGEDQAARVHRMLNRVRSRIQEGMNRNFQDFRTYFALDQLWDTPFRQVNPTMLAEFLDQDPNTDEVYKKVQKLGLTSFLGTKTDPKTGKEVKTFNVPVFFEVMVPLVRAYVTIRWAKIMNDRNLIPFFKFDPVISTQELQLKCDAITQRVQVVANQYGYYDVLKQAVLKMLHYSYCLLFPKEEWHKEKQYKYADEIDVMAGRAKSVGEEILVVDREGLRYHVPHPSRVYRDYAHGLNTINQDCGCEYAGYWRIARYREVANSNYWNKDRIALGTLDIMAVNSVFFQTVYSACTMKLPVAPQPKVPDANAAAAQFGLGSGNLDREKEVANLYYGTDHGDQGVLVTEHWEKLIPVNDGLGDYDQPVWFRFTMAGDGCTPLYAAPVPYCPVIYLGYDADESRSKNASLSLEIAPFQDHFSQTMSQIILTAKQNLANVTFVDTDQLDPAVIDSIRNMGENFYRVLNIFNYSSRRAARSLNKPADVISSHEFPKGSIQELTTVLKSILDILERVLVMSSQEIGQAAQHELRVDEVRNIAQATSSRLQFTATPVDIAVGAWKRQLYCGLMAYGDDDIFFHIPFDLPLSQQVLTAMGFTYIENAEHKSKMARDKFIRAHVKKKNTAIPLWEISATRDGSDRADNSKVAIALGQILQGLIANPLTAQAIGAEQAIEFTNRICKLAGMPMDTKFRDMSPSASPEEQAAQARAQLQQTVQLVLQQLQPELKPLLDETKKNGSDIALVMRELPQIMAALHLGPTQPQPTNDQSNARPPAG